MDQGKSKGALKADIMSELWRSTPSGCHPFCGAISYSNFEMIEGIPVATSWNFWGWNAAKGFSEEMIGEARLRNIQFMEKAKLFAKPGTAVQMKR